MAAAGCVRSEDQFLCSICLDVFTHPVTLPCGHNFCKSCITEHWDNNKIYKCPMCQKAFDPRPELYVNTFISEIVAQFRLETQHEPNIFSSDQQAAKARKVPCDDCSEPKLKAVKSCLVCLTSYCQIHLEPHLTRSGLKRHQLIHTGENLEDRMCRKHEKPLELFCKTDHTCICLQCPVVDHKNHEFVPLKDEYEEQKAELKKTEAEIQQMIQERRLKIQEIQWSGELSKNTADRETAEGIEVFTVLMGSAQRSLDQLLEEIQEQQRTTEKQTEDFIKELEQEICELEKRSTEVEQLSGSEDHQHFVQMFTCVKAAPSMKTWTKVSVCPPSYEETVMKALSELEDKLTEEKKKKVVEAELKRLHRYEVDLTLDPDTAHPNLILSEDGKQVHDGDEKKNLPDHPQRFSYYCSILTKQSFCSGRFYFEVQVKGKTKWDLGVARESVKRKGKITYSPRKGFWTIGLRDENEYYAADPCVHLSVQSGLQKVGVFVDYEEGLVSFYDVDSSVLIYSFNGCRFKEKLFPYFSPRYNEKGENSAPLIITPVKH